MDDRLSIRLWAGTARDNGRKPAQEDCNETDKHAEANIYFDKMFGIGRGSKGSKSDEQVRYIFQSIYTMASRILLKMSLVLKTRC